MTYNITKVNVYTDGSAKPNPGVGGYGVYIFYEMVDIFEFVQKYDEVSLYGLVENGKKTTNNRAELAAAIKALEYIQEHLKCDRVTIHSDSQFVVRGVTGVNKISANKDLFDVLIALNKPEYTWKLIPREENKVADRLANMGGKCTE